LAEHGDNPVTPTPQPVATASDVANLRARVWLLEQENKRQEERIQRLEQQAVRRVVERVKAGEAPDG
jgi:hypothetical protein